MIHDTAFHRLLFAAYGSIIKLILTNCLITENH